MVCFSLKLATLATLLFPLALSRPASSSPSNLDPSLHIIKFDKRSIPKAAYGADSRRNLDHAFKRGLDDIVVGDHPVARTVDRRANEIALTMVGDGIGWFAMVDVGTPPVAYPVLIDTGSSDLWIQSFMCTGAACTASPKYVRANSGTANDTGTAYDISYMDGTAMHAKNFRETVSWGGLTATSQLIGLAQTLDSSMEYPWGILGLGDPALSYSVYYLGQQGGGGATTFWQHMVRENGIADMYSFVVSGNSGQIVLGGIDWSKVYTNPGAGVDWSWNEMTGGPDSFTIEMTKMSINSVDIAVQSFESWWTRTQSDNTTLAGPGSTGIFVPINELPGIYGNVQNAFKYLSWAQGEIWAFPCSQAPPLEVFFGTQSYLISTATFASLATFPANGIDYCVGGIMGSAMLASEDNYWMLGDIFLQNVYTAVSGTNNSIGFAPFIDWNGVSYN